uniref:Uncharacterized protein n=1 Tax=Arundo donax TaxID=35708 RepID=A0A0A9FPT3_ARUDO
MIRRGRLLLAIESGPGRGLPSLRSAAPEMLWGSRGGGRGARSRRSG